MAGRDRHPDDPPAYSRPMRPLGKNDRRFEVGLPEVIYEKMSALALLKGYVGPTDWARDLIVKTILGEWEATRIRVGETTEKPEQFR